MTRSRILAVALGIVAAQGCKGVVKKSGELADATVDFKARRQVRVEALRAEHEAIGTQPLRRQRERDDAIGEAMDKLDDARKAAWKTLDDAPRTDRSS